MRSHNKARSSSVPPKLELWRDSQHCCPPVKTLEGTVPPCPPWFTPLPKTKSSNILIYFLNSHCYPVCVKITNVEQSLGNRPISHSLLKLSCNVGESQVSSVGRASLHQTFKCNNFWCLTFSFVRENTQKILLVIRQMSDRINYSDDYSLAEPSIP